MGILENKQKKFVNILKKFKIVFLINNVLNNQTENAATQTEPLLL